MGRAAPRGPRFEKKRFHDPFDAHEPTWVEKKLAGAPGPVVAVSDYMKAVPDQIREWVPGDYTVLGRGRLRLLRHARGPSLLQHRRPVRRGRCVLQQLARAGEVPQEWATEAAAKYRLDDVTAGSSGNAGGDS